MRRVALLTSLEQADQIDRVVDPARRAVHAVIRPPIRDPLHGVWLGHPLHPALTDLPLGSWTSAAVLDTLPGTGRGARILIGVGVAAALPTAVTGATDWASLSPEHRRVGLVHAVTNTVALSAYGASLVARVTGRYRAGKILGLLGLAAAGLGAFLGGHLTYGQGAGVDHAALALPRVPDGWHRLGELADLPERRLAVRHLCGVPIVLFRDDDQITALIGICSHLGGPLGDGTIIEKDGECRVICPWHGSTYRLADGALVAGPSTRPQRALECRIVDGRIEVRAARGKPGEPTDHGNVVPGVRARSTR